MQEKYLANPGIWGYWWKNPYECQFEVATALLLILLSDKTPGKAAKDDPKPWPATTHVTDAERVLGSSRHPSQYQLLWLHFGNEPADERLSLLMSPSPFLCPSATLFSSASVPRLTISVTLHLKEINKI